MVDATVHEGRRSEPVLGPIAEVNPRRSLILFAIGAALGLTIAGFGLFTAAGTKISGVPAEDVALINGRHILRSDFITQVQIETAQPFDKTTKAQRQKVLNEMVDEELLVQRGLEVDLAASDPDVRMAEVNGVQLQVDADVLAQQPSDEQLKAYYDAHKDKYAAEGIMALRDLVIKPDDNTTAEQAKQKAMQAAAAFRKGDGGDDVAATYSLKDSGKLDRGDLFDFAVRIKLSPALYAAAQKLSNHQASDPIEENGELHVLLMDKRQAPPERSFAEARDAVLQDFKKDEQTRVENANLTYLKSKADVQLAPEFRQ
jgi:parvulin-like peptidyl-prolyl isomerase